jgi:hypothetical protein
MFISQDGLPAVALFVPTGVEGSDVLKRLVEQVIQVGNLIAPLGIVAKDEPPSMPPDDNTMAQG